MFFHSHHLTQACEKNDPDLFTVELSRLIETAASQEDPAKFAEIFMNFIQEGSYPQASKFKELLSKISYEHLVRKNPIIKKKTYDTIVATVLEYASHLGAK